MARRTFSRGGRQVRETQWIFLQPGRDVMAASSTAAFVASLNAAALALRPFTVVRTIMHLSLKSDQTGVTEAFDASYGVAVVSDQSVAIGITAIPTPMTDMGSDLWLFHQILDGQFLFISGVGVDPNGVSPPGGITYESRAMRKVSSDQDLVFVTETSAASLGATMYSAGRILIKLH